MNMSKYVRTVISYVIGKMEIIVYNSYKTFKLANCKNGRYRFELLSDLFGGEVGSEAGAVVG
jgi:hypothetical protein